MAETPRQRHLRVKYGLTEQQFNELAARYDGACWICKKVPKGRLQVDHRHGSGEISGLLDWRCNKWLSYFWTPTLLRAAADYLEDGTGLYVPTKKKKRRKKR